MTWHFLTTDEAYATQAAMETLSEHKWAEPILANIGRAGGLRRESMPLLFEARYAVALLDAGVTPRYEASAGVGGTTVDFAFGEQPRWLVELLSLGETDAARAATWTTGDFFGRLLSSPSPPRTDEGSLDPDERARLRERRTRSPEGETLKAVERILAKASADDGTPAKFPMPDGKTFSMLAVDMRSFSNGGDEWDYKQIAFGAAAVPDEARHWWIADDGRRLPIRGLFDAGNPMRQAWRDREGHSVRMEPASLCRRGAGPSAPFYLPALPPPASRLAVQLERTHADRL